MKILLCGASLGIGGAETHMLQLAKGLAEKGHDVTVAARRGILCRELDAEKKIAFVDLPLDRGDKAAICFFKLLKIIKKGRFDIVHAHSRIAALLVAAVRRSSKKNRFGFVVTAHARYRRDALKDGLSVWGDACIAVSDDIKSHLHRELLVEEERITVIPNGIDTDKFAPRTDSEWRGQILFASRLDADCSLGAELLCRIAPRLCKKEPRFRVTIVGGGDALGRIQTLAREANRKAGRECVRLIGCCCDMPSAIEDADCVVGVSRVALEALAMERVAILFGNEGALGIFDKGKLLAAARSNFTARDCGNVNAEFLYSELSRLMSMKSEERKRLARFGRETALALYSAESVIGRTLDIYERVLAKSPVITVGGYYGFGNIGDEAVRRMLVNSLKREFSRVDIRLLSKKGRYESAAGERCVDRGSPRGVIKSLAESDVYICGGGSLLQNSTSLRSHAYYCGLIGLAKLCRCTCVIAAGGIGPLNGRLARTMARIALRLSDYVSVRDELSRRAVSSLTFGKVNAHLSADPTFASDMGGVSEGGGYVAIALRGGNRACGAALSIEGLCKRLGARPKLVTMDLGEDIADAVLLAELTGGKCVAAWSAEDVLSALDKSAAAVGSRLHFLIFALCKGVPFAAVGDDPKIVAFSLMTLGIPPIAPQKLYSGADVGAALEGYIESCREFYKNGGREKMLERCGELYGRDIARIAGLMRGKF